MTLLTAGIVFASHPELGRIRSAFVHATQNTDVRQALVAELTGANIAADYRNAYLGAAKTLLAECVHNPWSKWTHFQEGRDLIEQAIAADPKNPEFRYLRFLVQFKAPAFLGYDANLKEDYHYVAEYLKQRTKQPTWANYFEAFRVTHEEAINKRIHSNS